MSSSARPAWIAGFWSGPPGRLFKRAVARGQGELGR